MPFESTSNSCVAAGADDARSLELGTWALYTSYALTGGAIFARFAPFRDTGNKSQPASSTGNLFHHGSVD
jgi:hypothetical protein